MSHAQSARVYADEHGARATVHHTPSEEEERLSCVHWAQASSAKCFTSS